MEREVAGTGDFRKLRKDGATSLHTYKYRIILRMLTCIHPNAIEIPSVRFTCEINHFFATSLVFIRTLLMVLPVGQDLWAIYRVQIRSLYFESCHRKQGLDSIYNAGGEAAGNRRSLNTLTAKPWLGKNR